MAQFQVLIDSVDKALKFNKIIDRCEFEVDLVNGCTYVDAKSLVGIFSLPLYQPLMVITHTDEAASEKLREQLAEYVVEKVATD